MGFLGLSAAHPQEGRAIGSGPPGSPVKGKNPNPLESRVAAVVKDDNTDPDASEGPQNVGKQATGRAPQDFSSATSSPQEVLNREPTRLQTTWQRMRTQTASGMSSCSTMRRDGAQEQKRGRRML